MNIESRYPDLITKRGQGLISSEDEEIEVKFEIYYYPNKTIIECVCVQNLSFSSATSIDINNKWKLSGNLDNGVRIVVNNLSSFDIRNNPNSTKIKIFLESVDNILMEYCDPTNISYAEFPLFGVYDLNVQVEIEDWSIIIVSKNTENNKYKSRNWDLQLEGSFLKLVNKNATVDEYTSKAIKITNLLSLALGNNIIFNRQLYYNSSKLFKEIWGRRVESNLGISSCIPNYRIDKYLIDTLQNFEKWNEKKVKIFNSTVDFINSTSKGYLENRLLNTCIAWEGLAECLLENKPKTWENNSEKLSFLASQYELDEKKMSLDFKKLARMRNSVAHTGLFRGRFDNEDICDLISNHAFGLQIILLLELKYSDLIKFYENKWRKTENIKTMLKV